VIYVLDDGTTVDKLVKRISPDRLKTSCPRARSSWSGSARGQGLGGVQPQEVHLEPEHGQFYKAPPPTITVRHDGREGLCAAMYYARIMPA
jgi:hypothetical protein